jgi:hypothetical protein
LPISVDHHKQGSQGRVQLRRYDCQTRRPHQTSNRSKTGSYPASRCSGGATRLETFLISSECKRSDVHAKLRRRPRLHWLRRARQYWPPFCTSGVSGGDWGTDDPGQWESACERGFSNYLHTQYHLEDNQPGEGCQLSKAHRHPLRFEGAGTRDQPPHPGGVGNPWYSSADEMAQTVFDLPVPEHDPRREVAKRNGHAYGRYGFLVGAVPVKAHLHALVTR